MVDKRLVAVILSCLLATTGWAATTSPTLLATPPQPMWTELPVQYKIVLAPLSDDWDSLENYRQKKWLGIAARFAKMTPEEQYRIQGQMQTWGKLTSEERQQAREKFKTTSRLPIEKKNELKQKWAEYQNLPEEQKAKLQQEVASKPVPNPVGPAATLPPAASPPSPPSPIPAASPRPVPGASQLATETNESGVPVASGERR